jgi:GDP/UDP-N,N'-diacetylbacillosamine 2-epimerase (hydrolysing)
MYKIMRIGILTSSRADYGIYRPLLKGLQEDGAFETEIIAFGTHLSPYHGYTARMIEQDGFQVRHRINSLLINDDENAVATAVALTSLKFADFWKHYDRYYDVVFCLGDRYEMFGAVTAGIPYNIPFAHLHGGETTLGAFDNIYRHAISLASRYHFVATEAYKERLVGILGTDKDIYVVGSLSLDNLRNFKTTSIEAFKQQWHIDLSQPSVLITVHPETVNTKSNNEYLHETVKALETLAGPYQLVITMPNADTQGSVYREGFQKLKTSCPERVMLVENFGTQGYFSCMQHAVFMLGNTSSGIIEGASFKKYVINLGDRQKGRLTGENVLHTPFNADAILAAVADIERRPPYSGENIYDKGGAVDLIIQSLKQQMP